MRRRALLIAVGPLSFAGCTAGQGPADTESRSEESQTPEDESLPEECPASENLGVDWPRDLDASTVATFIGGYERTYYEQVVFEFEPASRYSSVGSAIARVKNVSEAGDGWRVRFSGILGIEEAFTRLNATTAEPADNANVISIGEVHDKQLTELLDEAADTGEVERRISAEDTDAYIDRFEELSERFEISPPDYRDTLHFDVNGTIVELALGVDTLPVDREWEAWYYVDEQVVWRSGEHDVDPREGALLECRTID